MLHAKLQDSLADNDSLLAYEYIEPCDHLQHEY